MQEIHKSRIISFLMIMPSLLASANPVYEEHVLPPAKRAKPDSTDPLDTAASHDVYGSAMPMIHYDNFNLIMPDYYDHHPAESMHFQNFETFYDPHMPGNMELKMDESRFVDSLPIRPPQPLSIQEKKIREKLENGDVKRERKVQQKLKKGSTKPKGEAYPQWDQFDYDLYSVDPGTSKKFIQGKN